MTRILFVCHGNICRSPLGEFIFKDLAIKAGYTVLGINDNKTKGDATSNAGQLSDAGQSNNYDLVDFDIASAATSTEEIGNPIYPPSLSTLLAHGIGTPDNELGVSKKRARQITLTDYNYYDLIIIMDQNNLRNMRRMFGECVDTDDKVHFMLEYAGRPGEEVADPWYTGGFDITWDDIMAGCKGLLEKRGNIYADK